MPEINTLGKFKNDPNLKFYARFESGALTTDSSGNSHTLSAISDPAECTGVFGGGAAFDSDDAYSATNHADLRPAGNFTISCWIKRNGNPAANAAVVANWNKVSDKYYGWMLQVTSSGVIAVYSAKGTGVSSGTDYATAFSGDSICDNTWHHIVGTWDGSYLRLYVDGVLKGKAAWANAPVYYSTMYFRVACRCEAGTNSQFLGTGYLDDIALYNGTVYLANDVKDIYEAESRFFLMF